MKILKESECQRFDKVLGDSEVGTVVEFKNVPHQKHDEGDIFLVLRVPSQYIKETERRNDDQVFRIMVANLRSGDCSLVIQTRACRQIKADVVKCDDY